MRMSILNAATTEQRGYGSISFFVCFLLMNQIVNHHLEKVLKYKPDAVYIEGELLITYPIIRALRKKHIPVYIKHKMEFVTI